jgi:ankyrin repeat protein
MSSPSYQAPCCGALGAQGGWTALHWTAERGHSAVASQLLAAGADARAANRVGVTPLHSAAEKNAGPVAALLLRAGADPRAANAVGDTPLHWCACAALHRTWRGAAF